MINPFRKLSKGMYIPEDYTGQIDTFTGGPVNWTPEEIKDDQQYHTPEALTERLKAIQNTFGRLGTSRSDYGVKGTVQDQFGLNKIIPKMSGDIETRNDARMMGRRQEYGQPSTIFNPSPEDQQSMLEIVNQMIGESRPSSYRRYSY